MKQWDNDDCPYYYKTPLNKTDMSIEEEVDYDELWKEIAKKPKVTNSGIDHIKKNIK